MLSEVITVAAIAATMTSIVIVDVAKAIGRAKTLSAVTSVVEVLSAARLHSVKRGVQIVVEVTVEPPPSRRINLRTFEDRSGDFLYGTYTLPPPASGTAPEVILTDFVVDSSYHLWRQGGEIDDVATAALFNGYAGNGTLRSRIVFVPDGGLIAPQSTDSANPTLTGGRGLYLADAAGTGFYRVTFPTTLIARPRVDKWTGAGYVPTKGTL
jgi:hypothetical protein